jgi:hypothetical protein
MNLANDHCLKIYKSIATAGNIHPNKNLFVSYQNKINLYVNKRYILFNATSC